MMESFKFERGDSVEWQSEPGRHFRRAQIVSRVGSYVGETPAYLYRVSAEGQEYWANEDQLRKKS